MKASRVDLLVQRRPPTTACPNLKAMPDEEVEYQLHQIDRATITQMQDECVRHGIDKSVGVAALKIVMSVPDDTMRPAIASSLLAKLALGDFTV